MQCFTIRHLANTSCRFHRQYSFGLQEFVEAESFFWFLNSKELVTPAKIEERLHAAASKKQVRVTTRFLCAEDREACDNAFFVLQYNFVIQPGSICSSCSGRIFYGTLSLLAPHLGLWSFP